MIPHTSHRSRGFSLIEVLLAVFILGIGLIMVASVFPVGANWTRQATEDSVAQSIAQTAVSVVETRCSALLADPSNSIITGGTPLKLQALPKFNDPTLGIPLTERAYQFGAASPFPVASANLQNCTYFWSALARVNPKHADSTGAFVTSSSYTYDLYILVFRKGDRSQTFTSGSEAPNLRPSGTTYFPEICLSTWQSGSYSSAAQAVTNAVPAIGSIGIGETSGTVFRNALDAVNLKATPRPDIIGGENVFYAAPADGTSASPLIYVYQTSLSF